MSLQKAQKIVNLVDEQFGISLVGYTTAELQVLKNKLVAFLDLEIDPEDLSDADEAFMEEDYEDSADEDECELDNEEN